MGIIRQSYNSSDTIASVRCQRHNTVQYTEDRALVLELHRDRQIVSGVRHVQIDLLLVRKPRCDTLLTILNLDQCSGSRLKIIHRILQRYMKINTDWILSSFVTQLKIVFVLLFLYQNESEIDLYDQSGATSKFLDIYRPFLVTKQIQIY